ncbi:phenylacetyl-CoA:acceptor oxidoreductase 26-kDa subunit [Burkholderiales bacterium]|nr:phenylacetyl-CoA:acceptor oxidoreductase 26-kDa subunit [Burkholderiales bacterium]
MSYSPPVYGPKPWLQRHWDVRAAMNFMCGGAGSGLLIASAIFDWAGTQTAPWLVGLALIGLGLASVWLEIGRKLRFLNVYLNRRTSWMTREAFVAVAVFGFGALAWLLVSPLLRGLTAVCALGFIYAQARILTASKGIPAWREKRLVPLILATGLVEGLCLFLLVVGDNTPFAVVITLLVALPLRWAFWSRYQTRVLPQLAKHAQAALAGVSRLGLWGGTALPMLLVVSPFVWPQGILPAFYAAGVLGAASGLAFKFVLVRRAAYNQGFALPHLPKRGRE